MSDSSIRRAFDKAVTVNGVLVGLAAFFIGVSVSYDVLARLLLGAATDWVVDVNTYLVAFIAFVGAGYGLHEDAHVSVDLVTRRLNQRSQKFLRLFSDTIVFAVSALFFYLGAEYCWSAWQMGERSVGLFSVPLWIPYICLPLGMAVLLIVQVVCIADRARRSRDDVSANNQIIGE